MPPSKLNNSGRRFQSFAKKVAIQARTLKNLKKFQRGRSVTSIYLGEAMENEGWKNREDKEELIDQDHQRNLYQGEDFLEQLRQYEKELNDGHLELMKKKQ